MTLVHSSGEAFHEVQMEAVWRQQMQQRNGGEANDIDVFDP